jgi:tryptophan synthase alpha subunit
MEELFASNVSMQLTCGNHFGFRLSYIPLIAPTTPKDRIKMHCSIASSFIYIVSRMGVTGSRGNLSSGISDLLSRTREFSGDIPTAVGFGVSTREHFSYLAELSDGVVIGSQIISVLHEAPAGEGARRVKKYVQDIKKCRNESFPNLEKASPEEKGEMRPSTPINVSVNENPIPETS